MQEILEKASLQSIGSSLGKFKKKKYFSVEILDYKEYQRDSVLFILLQVTTRHFIL